MVAVEDLDHKSEIKHSFQLDTSGQAVLVATSFRSSLLYEIVDYLN